MNVKEIYSDKLRVELKACYSRRDIYTRVEHVIKEGEIRIDDQNS